MEIQQTFDNITEDTNRYEYIICKICGKRFKAITNTHLSKHNLTVEEYKNIFPEARLECKKTYEKYIESGKRCIIFLKKYIREHPEHQKHAYDCLIRKNPNHQKETFLKLLKKDPNHQSKAGKIRVEQMINDTPYLFEGKKFLSKQELECYKILRQIFLVDDILVNMFIGQKSIDFFIKSLSLFIEYHPLTLTGGWIVLDETKEEYYQRRRQVLDENGYNKSKLLVFKNLKEVEEWIESLTK